MLDLTRLSGTQKKGKISKKKLLDKAVLPLVVFNQAEQILAVSHSRGSSKTGCASHSSAARAGAGEGKGRREREELDGETEVRKHFPNICERETENNSPRVSQNMIPNTRYCLLN